MQRELFRSSHGFNETNRPVQAQQDLQRTTTIQTLDLLEQNRSALTANDWTLLSNVLHAYDSKCPLKNIREQMEIQAKYPSKMRLKMVSANYMNLISHFYSTIVRFVEDIIHFSDLPPRDRLGLLHRNMASLGTFHGLFIVRELNLDQNYEYNYCATETYGPNISQRISRIASMLDQDGTLIKLLMAVLCFSTCHNYFLPDDRQSNSKRKQMQFVSQLNYDGDQSLLFLEDLTSESNALSNTTNLLTIQSLYAEILFKYMVFRYGYEEASTRFATLIRVVLELNKCLAAIREVQPYQAMIQEILDDTERTISSEEST